MNVDDLTGELDLVGPPDTPVLVEVGDELYKVVRVRRETDSVRDVVMWRVVLEVDPTSVD